MLNLERKVNESIIIGGNIRVTVLAITSNGVTLGTSAPDNVSINREEIELKLLQERLKNG